MSDVKSCWCVRRETATAEGRPSLSPIPAAGKVGQELRP